LVESHPKDQGRILPRASVAAMVLVVLFILALIGLAALMVWQNYAAALAAGEARARSSAHVVAAHIEWMVQAGDQALHRIDASVATGALAASPETTARIAAAVGDLPPGFHYAVYDATGRVIASSRAALVGTDIGQRDYFLKLRQGAPLVITTRLKEPTDGEMVFLVARPILRGGSFAGAGAIAIPTARMNEFWTSIGLGPHSTISLIREDGALITRHPELDRPIDLSATPLFAALKAAPAGVYHSELSPADGRARIVGFRKIDRWPLIAAAGIDRDEALDLFWVLVRSEITLGLPIIALLIVCVLWIVRLVYAYGQRNDALEAAVERNRVLFREIHHRVKNNLQAVNSLIRLSPLPRGLRDEMARRIAAMVAVHEHIYRSDQFDRVEIAPYAERLIQEIVGSHQANVAITTNLAPVSVSRDAALPIGMILNETVSNAFKYAFGPDREGWLSVELRREGDNDICLVVRDNGPGFDPATTEKGMGSKLIDGFVGQLGGHYSFSNDGGTVFSMTFPLR
jgi:two-component system, sensor histidine kinase PdtaS